MPMHLEGGCKCGAVSFTVDSHEPCPYQLCYCSICRKTAGGGGFAINLGGIARTLKVTGEEHLGTFRATVERDGKKVQSSARRHYCTACGSALWVFDPEWPELVHPFASAIDTPLPVPPVRTHVFLGSKADWVTPDIGPDDLTFDEYPEVSIADWHRQNGMRVD